MTPSQDFKPLGFIENPHCKKKNFLTLFFGQPRSNQRRNMSYQMIAQWELLHKNHNFVIDLPKKIKLLKY
jgi:hypothetical protein